MNAKLTLYSNKKGELNNFLSSFYNTNLGIFDSLKWEKESANPIELADIIGVFIDNYDNFDLYMLVSFDKDIFINITNINGNSIIKYLFERFPY